MWSHNTEDCQHKHGGGQTRCTLEVSQLKSGMQ